MEFTTHFGLHSQTTRLLRRSRPHSEAPVKALHPLWVKPRSGGLGRSHVRLLASHTPQFRWAIIARLKASELPFQLPSSSNSIRGRAASVRRGSRVRDTHCQNGHIEKTNQSPGQVLNLQTERAAGRGEYKPTKIQSSWPARCEPAG